MIRSVDNTPAAPTPQSVADEWIASLASRHSQVAYKHDLENFCTAMAARNTDLVAVRVVDVKQWLDEMAGAGTTKSRALSVVRAFYSRLRLAGLVDENPALGIRVGRKPRRTPWLTIDEIKALVAHVDGERERAAIALLAGTGLRRSSVVATRAGDVVQTERGWCVTAPGKGGKVLKVLVAGWALEPILTWRGNVRNGYLFPAATGSGHATERWLWSVVKAAGVRAHIQAQRCTPHAIRRGLATDADRRGVPLRDIQLALGHSSIATTERYLRGVRVPRVALGDQ